MLVIQSQAQADKTAEPGDARDDVRERIIVSAIDLLNREGRDAVTTRAVADAAGVQAPAIYRLFRDKEGLLGAVAQYGFAKYLSEKTLREPHQDPVEDLRNGWDLHVAFGLSHPALYVLMYAEPRPGAESRAAEAAYPFLKAKIRRIAAAGRLRFSEEQAADLFHASACGTVLTLLAKAEERRDIRLSEIARETAISAITTGSPAFESSEMVTSAVSLRAVLPETKLLSDGERSLLAEWLDRIALKGELVRRETE